MLLKAEEAAQVQIQTEKMFSGLGPSDPELKEIRIPEEVPCANRHLMSDQLAEARAVEALQ